MSHRIRKAFAAGVIGLAALAAQAQMGTPPAAGPPSAQPLKRPTPSTVLPRAAQPPASAASALAAAPGSPQITVPLQRPAPPPTPASAAAAPDSVPLARCERASGPKAVAACRKAALAAGTGGAPKTP